MERRINLDNQDIAKPLNIPIQGLNGKIPLETLTLVEQLATGLNRQQSEFVALKTFIGFNE